MLHDQGKASQEKMLDSYLAHIFKSSFSGPSHKALVVPQEIRKVIFFASCQLGSK